MVFERRRRHLERYLEIGRILAKHGWANLLTRLGLADLFRLRRRGGGVPQPVQVRMAIEELGPAFIKLGQLLSTRPDIVPADYVVELERLQDRAPEVPFPAIREVIQDEFGVPVEDLFAAFDELPLAAASLGQTHVATLNDGAQVVVKVQRPGVKPEVETDLEIVASIARFLENRWEMARIYHLSDLVDEFSITIRQELDYMREGRNSDLLRQNLSDLAYVRIAATVWEYTTPRVLTSECLCGIKITDFAKLDAEHYDRRQIATNLSRSFFGMIFVDGFFHGDPHPGNLVVMEDNTIGLFDYGIVGRLQQELKTRITMLLANYVEQDSMGFARVLLVIGSYPPELDRKAFEQDIDRLLRQYYGAPLRDVNMGEVLSRALKVSGEHRVSLPPSLALLIKVILGIDSLDRALYPDFDLASEARPFIARSARDEFSLIRMKDELLENLLEWKAFLLKLPRRTADVLDHMAEGRFRVHFRHEGLEGPVRDLDKAANRLSFALVVSATIVASALILSSQVGPLWNGYSVLGVIGFGVAFVFAAWLMISIIRGGKLW